MPYNPMYPYQQMGLMRPRPLGSPPPSPYNMAPSPMMPRQPALPAVPQRPSSSLAAGTGQYSPWEQGRLSTVGMPNPMAQAIPDRAAGYAPIVANLQSSGDAMIPTNMPNTYSDGSWRDTPEGRRNHVELLRFMGNRNPMHPPSGPNLSDKDDIGALEMNRAAGERGRQGMQQRLDDGWKRQISNAQNQFLVNNPVFGLPNGGGVAGQLAMGLTPGAIAEMQRSGNYATGQAAQIAEQQASRTEQARQFDATQRLRERALALGSEGTPAERVAAMNLMGGTQGMMANPMGMGAAPLPVPEGVDLNDSASALQYLSTQPGLNAETLTRNGYTQERLLGILNESQKYFPGSQYWTEAGRQKEAVSKRLAEELLRKYFPDVSIPLGPGSPTYDTLPWNGMNPIAPLPGF